MDCHAVVHLCSRARPTVLQRLPEERAAGDECETHPQESEARFLQTTGSRGCSSYISGMSEKRHHPVSRDDLEYTIAFALNKAHQEWPARRTPGDPECVRPLAAAVVDHLEFCDMRAFAKAPPPSHTITAAAGDAVGAGSGAAQHHGIPVARAVLEFAVASALLKGRRPWPKRLMRGDIRHLRPLARRVVDQLETSRLHVFQALSWAPAAAPR